MINQQPYSSTVQWPRKTGTSRTCVTIVNNILDHEAALAERKRFKELIESEYGMSRYFSRREGWMVYASPRSGTPAESNRLSRGRNRQSTSKGDCGSLT